MFKQLTAIFFLLTITAQTFSGPMLLAGYYINTTPYLKNCINKSSPKIQCNGKCQLMKKLRRGEKKDPQNTERRSAQKKLPLYTFTHFPMLFLSPHNMGEMHPTANTPIITRNRSAVFQPPK